MFTTREATANDLYAITEIYNEAIVNNVATFDTEPKTTYEQERWFEDHDSKHPILVAEMDDLVVGWASLSKWSDRCAYTDTGEVSLYIRAADRGKGIGRELLFTIIKEGKNVGLHTIIARIAEGNIVSIHLCETMGFRHIGTMKEVGKKFGRLLDVHLMQKIYSE